MIPAPSSVVSSDHYYYPLFNDSISLSFFKNGADEDFCLKGMGTEVHYKNSFYSMRNVNEDSNSNSWHLFYGDNTFTNSHYYNNLASRTVTDPYLSHEKYEVKQKMLQHEAIFKNQVYELHRLYRRQRDMMDEVKRKEFNKYQFPNETSSSSSFMPSQKPYEDSHKWQIPSRPSIFGVEISNNSPISCSKGNNDSKDCEVIDCRPSKVRKKLFDLQLPAHEYIDPEDDEQVMDNQASEISSCFLPKNGVKTFLENGYRNPASGQHWSNGLSEPVYIQEVQHRANFSEISSKFQDYSRFNQTPSMLMNPFIGTSDNLNRKLQKHPSFLSSNRGDKWDGNGCYGNRFFHGSSSGSKELSARVPSTGFDYRNCNKIDNGSKKIFIDLTDTTKGMDLNTVQTLSDNEDDSRKCDQPVLPWLKSKPVISKNGDVSKEKDNKKLLGFPFFGNCKNDDSSSMEHRGIDINVAWDDVIDDKWIDREETEIKNFKNHFDLNSCVTEDDDELLVTESVKSSKKKRTMEIDLEAPAVSEIEEEEEAIRRGEEHEKTVELEKIVAEAIVEISHVGPTENSGDTLLWFVEVVEKHTVFVARETDEYEMLTLRIEESKEEEYMPQPLVPDVQELEEGPGPALTSRPRRGQARRGRPRRDFQRDILPGMESLSRHEITEDLQIFGGLMKATGHSWNFGSMKRNGKRVGARGRRKGKVVEITPVAAAPPPVPPPPPAVVGLEERRFTGWGKTTRRPRRQRCAVSNSVAVQST
ncbi:hypothetical protein L1887_30610 [Cichorium endivia]|nr:hypothetical protein L1887_30610 [Cichorium endivia]